MIKKVSILLFVGVLHFVGIGQNSQKVTPQKKNIHRTYQFEVIISRQHPNIAKNLDQLILKNRNATETVYVALGSSC
jgi:hypothetical protein